MAFPCGTCQGGQDTCQQASWRVVNEKKKKKESPSALSSYSCLKYTWEWLPSLWGQIQRAWGCQTCRKALICQAVWEKTSCNWQSISPFPLYGHPWQINHNQMLAAARGNLHGKEEKWGLTLVWQSNLSTHPLDWTRGHCGLSVTTTTQKQTARPAARSLADPLRQCRRPTSCLINQCYRERKKDSLVWGRDTRQCTVVWEIGEDSLAQQNPEE